VRKEKDINAAVFTSFDCSTFVKRESEEKRKKRKKTKRNKKSSSSRYCWHLRKEKKGKKENEVDGVLRITPQRIRPCLISTR